MGEENQVLLFLAFMFGCFNILLLRCLILKINSESGDVRKSLLISMGGIWNTPKGGLMLINRYMDIYQIGKLSRNKFELLTNEMLDFKDTFSIYCYLLQDKVFSSTLFDKICIENDLNVFRSPLAKQQLYRFAEHIKGNLTELEWYMEANYVEKLNGSPNGYHHRNGPYYIKTKEQK